MVDREKLLSSRGSTGTVVIPESSRVRAQGVGVTVGVVRAGSALRVLRLHLLCQRPGGVSAAEAAQALGVVARTIHKDMAVLRLSGVRVTVRGGRYYGGE
jgi:biotin operon repressor